MSSKKAGIWPSAPNAARGQVTKLATYGTKLVYANGRTILIRDIEDPATAISYTGHVQPTTVARISPSGYYCASADSVGNVRIWDIVGEDNVLKGEYRVLGGKVVDLAWDGESKRIIAAGDGKDKFAHAFLMDSGSSTGDIIGHNKTINAVAIRHQRPFKAVTASDDRTIVFHSGVPWKYERTIVTHNNFVLSLAYSDTGDHFASSGADYKVFVYDGKTGDTAFELADAHKGSVTSAAWSPDSKSLLTSSADCTVKLWDVETQKSTNSWTVGSGVQYQQVGNAWLNKSGSNPDTGIVSLSVSGDINVFDKRTADKPVRVLHGPQKAVTCSTVTSSGNFIAGSADGRVVVFSESKTGDAIPLSGEVHSGYVSGITSTPNAIWSIGYDDRIRELNTSSGTEFTSSSGVSTTSQPKAIAAGGDLAFVAESNNVEIFKSGTKVASVPVKYEAMSIAVSASGTVAVGAQDGKIYLYDNTVKQSKGTFDNNRSAVTALAFSPDSKLLAAGESSGKIMLYDVTEMKLVTSRWTYHSARINDLSWASDSLHLASASLDTDIFIWSVAKPMRTVSIKNAVPGGANTVSWLECSETKGVVAGAGADPTVRLWEVTFHT